MKIIAFLFLFIHISVNAKTVNCIKDPEIFFNPEGIKTFKGLKVRNYFFDGECSFVITAENRSPDLIEKYTVTDKGLLRSAILTKKVYPSDVDSRARGSKSYYLFPLKNNSLSYEVNEAGGRISFNLPNGSIFSLSTETGEILDLTGYQWRQDRRALRSYIKNGREVATDVMSENCSNCSLAYKVPHDRFEYKAGGIVIEDSSNYFFSETQFRRSVDARKPILWGKSQLTTINDHQGNNCQINNCMIYQYIGHRSNKQPYVLNQNGSGCSNSLKIESIQPRFTTISEQRSFLAKECPQLNLQNLRAPRPIDTILDGL